ncbi:MAG TPA: AAA family ATPase [Abditibacteriaceae bacterium]|jgi:ATP-dependent 26S proteasome regulatory subunit
MNDKDREIDIHIRARYPIIFVVSYEETRVEDAIKTLVNGQKVVLSWSATEPFGVTDGTPRIALDGFSQAIEALNFILKKLRNESTRAVFLLKDFEPYFGNPVVERRLRDVVYALKRSYSTLIFLSPTLIIPPHLEKDIAVVDYDLPTFHDLGEILDELVSRVGTNPNVQIELDPSTRESLVKAAQGLTADEAANVFAKALVLNAKLDALDIGVVLSEKKQIIRKTGMLEFTEAQEHFSDIGGLDELKRWLDKRRNAFGERARDFGLPAPRGILLLGVPGCGKSLTAKAVGAAWKLPLLRFDVGSVFGKYVGESEANLRRALRAAEAVAPCVLWIDEMEKAFSVSRGDDGGTTLRIFGAFLSWLQDKKAPVFVIGTANSVDQLPPELLRRGRLDEIFFVDLPGEAERRDIFGIHIAKRGRDVTQFDLAELATASDGFSGAEIEQAVAASLYDAFEQNRDISTADILSNLGHLVPLSRTMSEEIEGLREWASTRARPAS